MPVKPLRLRLGFFHRAESVFLKSLYLIINKGADGSQGPARRESDRYENNVVCNKVGDDEQINLPEANEAAEHYNHKHRASACAAKSARIDLVDAPDEVEGGE